MSKERSHFQVFERLLNSPYYKDADMNEKVSETFSESVNEWNADDERGINYDIGTTPINSDKVRSTVRRFFKGSADHGIAGATVVCVKSDMCVDVVINSADEIDSKLDIECAPLERKSVLSFAGGRVEVMYVPGLSEYEVYVDGKGKCRNYSKEMALANAEEFAAELE